MPYNGRTEFLGSSGRERWVADRVEVPPSQISGALCSASRRTRRNGPALRLVVPHSSYRPAGVGTLAVAVDAAARIGERLSLDVGEFRRQGQGSHELRCARLLEPVAAIGAAARCLPSIGCSAPCRRDRRKSSFRRRAFWSDSRTTRRPSEKTPWWLTLIRLLAATFVILALAEPVLNPSKEAALVGDGPVVIFVDNGWAAASHWSERVRHDRSLHRRRREQRHDPSSSSEPPPRANFRLSKIESAERSAKHRCRTLPQPFEPDRTGAVSALETALEAATVTSPSIVWLHDGIDHKSKVGDIAKKLAALAGNGSFAVLDETKGHEPLGSRPRISATKASSKPSFFLPADRSAKAASTPIRRAASGWAKRPFKLGAGATSADVDVRPAARTAQSGGAHRNRRASDRPVPSASSMR